MTRADPRDERQDPESTLGRASGMMKLRERDTLPDETRSSRRVLERDDTEPRRVALTERL